MKALLSGAVLLASIAAAPAANAIVIDWDFVLDSRFGDATFEPGEGPGSPGTTTEDIYDITWGQPDGDRSSIHIRDDDAASPSAEPGGPVEGSITTNGPFVAGNQFFHDNRIIQQSSDRLDATSVTVNFTLTPTNPPDGSFEPVNPTFLVDFRETLNVGGPGCESGVGECHDIFVIDIDAPFTPDAEGGFFTFTFDYLGDQYFIDLRGTGFGLLTEQQCTATGAGPICVGFITEEEALNQAQFFFRIRAEEVPEPAALGLLGVGLIGVAAARRRKA